MEDYFLEEKEGKGDNASPKSLCASKCEEDRMGGEKGKVR